MKTMTRPPTLASVMSSWIYKNLVLGEEEPARLRMHSADSDNILQVLFLDKTTVACHFPAVSDPGMQTRIVGAVRALWQLANNGPNGWKAEISRWPGASIPAIFELAVGSTGSVQDSSQIDSQLAAMRRDLALGDVAFVLALNDVSQPAELAKLFKYCLGSMAHFAIQLATADQSGQLEWSFDNRPPSIAWSVHQTIEKRFAAWYCCAD
jgi:hypothetical protein